ncbi:MAG: hypothetical protein Alpg2KO_03670 [Alphaproteobacteria bacterium]
MLAAVPIVMLVGPSGVGKTSFGRHLAAHLDVPLYSSDQRMVALHGPTPPADQFAALQKAVRDQIWEEVAKGAQQRRGAVLDLGFWTKAGRQRSWDRIAALHCLDIVIEVTCDPDTSRQRVLSRTARQDKDQLAIDDAALDRFADMWEPLEDGEAHFSIDGTKPPEQQMQDYRILIRSGLV